MSESERYAGRKLYHDFNLSQIELDLFLGVIHLSGYAVLRSGYINVTMKMLAMIW